MNRLLLRIPEVAEKLGVSAPTVYRYVAEEGLPSLKLGRAHRIALDDLQEWIAARPRGTPHQPAA